MNQIIREDILGNIPAIGDIIVFNPPAYKGIIHSTCIGFTKVGLPMINNISRDLFKVKYEIDNKGFYVPKTGFVVIKANYEK